MIPKITGCRTASSPARFASRQATCSCFPALFTKYVGDKIQFRMSKASNVIIKKEKMEICNSDVQKTHPMSCSRLNTTSEVRKFFERRERNFPFLDYSY